MKKLLIVLFVICSHFAFSQSLPDFDKIRLEQKADYKPADSLVLVAANYVLTTPYEKNDPNRTASYRFIIRWMTGTPDYSFALDLAGNFGKVLNSHDEYSMLYMAAMTKYALENKTSASNNSLVKLNAVKLLIGYCENENNNMKMTKPMKKWSEANKKGELEASL